MCARGRLFRWRQFRPIVLSDALDGVDDAGCSGDGREEPCFLVDGCGGCDEKRI